jgi:hypothetical protein
MTALRIFSEGKSYSLTFVFVLDQKGLSFLGSLIHMGDGISMEQRDQDDGKEFWIYEAHAVSARSGEVVWVSSRIRQKSTLGHLSLWPDTETDPTGIPCIPTRSLFPSLSLSLPVTV